MGDNQQRVVAILARVELAIRAQWRRNQPKAEARLVALEGMKKACINDPALCDVLMLAFDVNGQPTEPVNP